MEKTFYLFSQQIKDNGTFNGKKTFGKNAERLQKKRF